MHVKQRYSEALCGGTWNITAVGPLDVKGADQTDQDRLSSKVLIFDKMHDMLPCYICCRLFQKACTMQRPRRSSLSNTGQVEATTFCPAGSVLVCFTLCKVFSSKEEMRKSDPAQYAVGQCHFGCVHNVIPAFDFQTLLCICAPVSQCSYTASCMESESAE